MEIFYIHTGIGELSLRKLFEWLFSARCFFFADTTRAEVKPEPMGRLLG